MLLIDFHFDFESRSRSDLRKVGSVRYVNDPSTEATLLTYCFGRSGSLKYWRKGQPIPQDLLHVAHNPHLYRFIAWNVQFDYLVWTVIFSRLTGSQIRPPVENIDDAMGMSNHYRTGASLEACAKFFDLPINKDSRGRVLMLKQCKPNSKGIFPELTEPEWQSFIQYGLMDTRILREVYYRLPPLPSMERYAWEWTFRRNLRGIRVDMDLVYELKQILAANYPHLEAEFKSITGCTINSHVKVREFFQPYFPWIENMRADTVREMLLKDPAHFPPQVWRALEIKDLAGSTSISKVDAILDRHVAGVIYELLVYHKAGTKRWAGSGVQMQNFPRPNDKLLDSIDFNMNVRDLAEYIRLRKGGLKDPIGFVVNLLRRVWLPTPGNAFYCGDFSKVEPSVLFWLLDMGPIPKKWYEEMAAEIYNRDVSEISKEGQERQIGKAANLSCQYGTGWKGFQKSVFKDTGIRLSEGMCKQVISAYRRKNYLVVQFWKELEDAFRLAIYGQSTALCRGRIHVMPMQHMKGVMIRLPSGSHLYYHQAREGVRVWVEEEHRLIGGVKVTTRVKKSKTTLQYMCDQGEGRIDWEDVYGGLLCENVVSAAARDILVPTTWRLEQAGFDVLGLVHDEVWGDARPGRDNEFTAIMCVNPSWCDMQITADLKAGVRYLK